MGESIQDLIMRRDGVDRETADEMVRETKLRLRDFFDGCAEDDPEEIVMEELGLEPDYLMDLLEEF